MTSQSKRGWRDKRYYYIGLDSDLGMEISRYDERCTDTGAFFVGFLVLRYNLEEVMIYLV